MMHLLLTLTICFFLSLKTAVCAEALPEQENTNTNPIERTTINLPNNFSGLNHVISLKELAQIYAKRLHDRDAAQNSALFDDKEIQSKIIAILDEKIKTLEIVLQKEAPELYNRVHYEHTKPQRIFIYRCLGVAAVTAGTLTALCAYNPTTNEWESPKIDNGFANVDKAIEYITRLFTTIPPAGAPGLRVAPLDPGVPVVPEINPIHAAVPIGLGVPAANAG